MLGKHDKPSISNTVIHVAIYIRYLNGRQVIKDIRKAKLEKEFFVHPSNCIKFCNDLLFSQSIISDNLLMMFWVPGYSPPVQEYW